MLCENCNQNNATTHIKRTVNGVTKEYYLCPYCASKFGMSNFSFFDMSDLFNSVFENKKFVKEEKRCKSCNTSFNEIAKSGKLGCPECYREFREEISPSLLKIHGKNKHISNVSVKKSTTSNKNENSNEIENLEKELKEAIATENFEKAAELRDIIKAKRGEQNG